MNALISAGLRELVRLMGEKGKILVSGNLGGEFGYGADYDSEVFMMHAYCWCDKEDCPWCEFEAPNFHHKKTGLKVWWYKYIGRGMKVENPSGADFVKILVECMDDVRSRENKEVEIK